MCTPTEANAAASTELCIGSELSPDGQSVGRPLILLDGREARSQNPRIRYPVPVMEVWR